MWSARSLAPGNRYAETQAGKWGWRTTPGNHEYMVQMLANVIREGLWSDPEEQAWTEIMGIVRSPQGKALISGRDRTAARCILATIDTLAPPAEVTHLVDESRKGRYDYRSREDRDGLPSPGRALKKHGVVVGGYKNRDSLGRVKR